MSIKNKSEKVLKLKNNASTILPNIDNIKEQNLGEILEGPYLFISYDIANSTAYKALNKEWPDLFDKFFTNCYNETIKRIIGNVPQNLPNTPLKEWKRLGDEIIFYLKISDLDNLTEIPEKIFNALNAIIKAISSYRKEAKLELSVRATLWSAIIKYEYKNNISSSVFNIIRIKNESYDDGDDVTKKTSRIRVLDFLGPDIDIGFRISRYSQSGILVIDANLAWLLEKHTQNPNGKMKIVTLKKLKGIWCERRYPIIWYYEDWKRIIDNFPYDQEYFSKIVKLIKKNIKEDNYGFKTTEQLEKMLKDTNNFEYAVEFENSIEKRLLSKQ
jgi:hypothetical protein